MFTTETKTLTTAHGYCIRLLVVVANAYRKLALIFDRDRAIVGMRRLSRCVRFPRISITDTPPLPHMHTPPHMSYGSLGWAGPGARGQTHIRRTMRGPNTEFAVNMPRRRRRRRRHKRTCAAFTNHVHMCTCESLSWSWAANTRHALIAQ